jgi:hypothetical protein
MTPARDARAGLVIQAGSPDPHGTSEEPRDGRRAHPVWKWREDRAHQRHQTMQRGLSGALKDVRLIALRGLGETLGIPAHQGWQTLSGGNAMKDSSSSRRSSS